MKFFKQHLSKTINSKQVSITVLFFSILVLVFAQATFGIAKGEVIPSSRQASITETLQYDMYDTGTDDVVDPIPVSTIALPLGEFYFVTVSGTFSFWEIAEWDSVCAGSPEPSPQTPSPGTQNGLVGVDAEYIFAHPCFMYDGSSLPLNIPNFEISTDNQQTWFDPISIGGSYSSSHVYRYAIRSEGHPIAFRELDSPTIDNYGVLTIEIGGLQQKLFLPVIQR